MMIMLAAFGGSSRVPMPRLWHVLSQYRASQSSCSAARDIHRTA